MVPCIVFCVCIHRWVWNWHTLVETLGWIQLIHLRVKVTKWRLCLKLHGKLSWEHKLLFPTAFTDFLLRKMKGRNRFGISFSSIKPSASDVVHFKKIIFVGPEVIYTKDRLLFLLEDNLREFSKLKMKYISFSFLSVPNHSQLECWQLSLSHR